jgi:hypothetical protein
MVNKGAGEADRVKITLEAEITVEEMGTVEAVVRDREALGEIRIIIEETATKAVEAMAEVVVALEVIRRIMKETAIEAVEAIVKIGMIMNEAEEEGVVEGMKMTTKGKAKDAVKAIGIRETTPRLVGRKTSGKIEVVDSLMVNKGAGKADRVKITLEAVVEDRVEITMKEMGTVEAVVRDREALGEMGIIMEETATKAVEAMAEVVVALEVIWRIMKETATEAVEAIVKIGMIMNEAEEERAVEDGMKMTTKGEAVEKTMEVEARTAGKEARTAVEVERAEKTASTEAARTEVDLRRLVKQDKKPWEDQRVNSSISLNMFAQLICLVLIFTDYQV